MSLDNWKEYFKLCDRVERLDPDASAYMRTEAKELESFCPAFSLSGSFFWSDTPQGHEYWARISRNMDHCW